MSTGEGTAASRPDPLVSVSIKIRASQREKVRNINLSEGVRDWIDRGMP
jgi:hypothetical protein